MRRLKMPTSSQRFFRAEAQAGGMRPKSPGFLLEEGCPHIGGRSEGHVCRGPGRMQFFFYDFLPGVHTWTGGLEASTVCCASIFLNSYLVFPLRATAFFLIRKAEKRRRTIRARGRMMGREKPCCLSYTGKKTGPFLERSMDRMTGHGDAVFRCIRAKP